MDPNIVRNEDCQLLTATIGTKLGDFTRSIRPRKRANTNRLLNSEPEPKRIFYNLRSNSAINNSKEVITIVDEDDDDEDEDEVKEIEPTSNTKIDLKQEIKLETPKSLDLIKNVSTPQKDSINDNNFSEMLDLVNEIIQDQEDNFFTFNSMASGSPEYSLADKSSVISLEMIDHKKDNYQYQEIYKELFSVCNRN